MRHETCLICRLAPDKEPKLHALIVVAESLTPATHHHHAIECEGCGAWWFDDIVLDAAGRPVPLRRGSVMCGCDETARQYPRRTLQVPAPESACACTAASVGAIPTIEITLGR